jgi:hypothetical protein
MSDWTYLEKALGEITGAMSRLSLRVSQLESAPIPITWTGTAIAGVVVTVLTAVPHAAVVMYALYETVGGAVAGTVTGVGLAGTTDLYNVGGDICTLALSAGGTLTVQRTGGASTYNVSLIILPI